MSLLSLHLFLHFYLYFHFSFTIFNKTSPRILHLSPRIIESVRRKKITGGSPSRDFPSSKKERPLPPSSTHILFDFLRRSAFVIWRRASCYLFPQHLKGEGLIRRKERIEYSRLSYHPGKFCDPKGMRWQFNNAWKNCHPSAELTTMSGIFAKRELQRNFRDRPLLPWHTFLYSVIVRYSTTVTHFTISYTFTIFIYFFFNTFKFETEITQLTIYISRDFLSAKRLSFW